MHTTLVRRTWKTAVAAIVFATLSAVPARAVPVGLELLLLVDVSVSVDSSEYSLQKTGYINAFRDSEIQSAIASLPGGAAVAYAEWADATHQALLVDWMLVTDAASSNAFADAIAATGRPFNGMTAPGSAINWGVPLFGNSYEGGRLVLDISGDGAENVGANTFAAATAAHAAGITINGLPILGEPGLDTWYQANIVTPGGGFLTVASSFGSFGSAVKTKISREITGVPEPALFSLFGVALLGLAARRRLAAR